MLIPVVRASTSNISASIVCRVACMATPGMTKPTTIPSQMSHAVCVPYSAKAG
jgi:hypothetical protein